MNYFSKEDLISFNYEQYKDFGGSYFPPFNLKEEGALDYIIEMIQHDEYYSTIFEKAALLAWNINKNHVFFDGNKRTALYSAVLFLEYNFFELLPSITSHHLTDFALDIAKGEITREEVIDWFKINTRPL